MADKEYLGGVTNTTLHFEADGETMHIEEKQDCEPIMDYAKACRDHRYDAWSPEGTVRHVAEIPAVIYVDECRKRNIQPYSKEGDLVIEIILADPAYAYFLAAPALTDARVIMTGVK